jgi:formamidopyrimidine-DNA glycosylase
MPELPEVETVRRSLAGVLAGRRIAETTRISWERTIAEPAPELFRELLRDRLITGVDRRAKYLIIRLDRGESLVVHLRMTGRLTIEDDAAEPDPHTHVVLRLDGGGQLFFRDTRKFGRIWLLDAEGLRVLQQHLGPEPLDEALTAEEWRTLLRRRKGRLKPLLLDQKLIAGLGNIYVDEALHRANIHPTLPANAVRGADLVRLHEAIGWALERGIEQGGAKIVHQKAYPRDGFPAAHGREGEPCLACGGDIAKTRVGGRGTYLCPTCQPAP